MKDKPTRHYLVCRRCHSVIHLDESLLGELNVHLEQKYQFHQIALELQIIGYCDTCWLTEQQQSPSVEHALL